MKSFIATSLSSYSRQLRDGLSVTAAKDLPDPTGKFNGLPADIMNAVGYGDLLDACPRIGKAAR
jgi:hypothetical protein